MSVIPETLPIISITASVVSWLVVIIATAICHTHDAAWQTFEILNRVSIFCTAWFLLSLIWLGNVQ